MREMYMKYDVIEGYKLTGIRMGKGVISALNYVNVSDKSNRMELTVEEFEAITNKVSEFKKYDVMLGYRLMSIMKGKGEISGLKFVSKERSDDRLIVTGDDLVAYKHYVEDLVAVEC